MTNNKPKTFKVGNEEFTVVGYEKLYRWHQTNPETLLDFLTTLAEKLYGGNLGSAGAALESDLENQVASS